MIDFDAIYEKHRSNVHGVCLRILWNTADAEDMTQEVFIKVFRKMDSFRGESALSTWIYRIAVNECLMHLRKRTVVNEATTENGEMPEAAGRINVINKIAVEEALRQLPKGYRNVLVLHDVIGLEHAEVAEMLGCSEGTSKSQFSKAKAKMRRLLGKRVNPRMHQPMMAAA